MSVYVIGAGSIGVFLATRLAERGGVDVTLVGREESMERFEPPVTVIEGGAPREVAVRCVGWSGIERIEAPALVLVATKVFQLPGALAALRERCASAKALPAIFLCQNGLEVIEEAERSWKGPRYGRAICWIGARLDYTPSARVLVSGVQGIEIAGGETRVVAQLEALFRKAGIPTTVRPTVSEAEWRKAIWNLTTNGLGALAGVPNGIMAEDPWLRPLAEALLDEALQVAVAEGLRLTAEDRERVFEATRRSGSSLNSTLQDLRAGRPTEMPWLNGALLRKAEKHGIPVPNHRFVHHLVRFLEVHRRG